MKNKIFLNKIVDYVGRLVCPPHCICCGEVFNIDDDRVFCHNCTEQVMSRISNKLHAVDDNLTLKIYCCMNYNSFYAHKIIAHAKYVSSKQFLSTFASICANFLETRNLLQIIDIVTFSPRRPGVVRYYGFDQSEELSKAISEKTGIQYKASLKRVKRSKEQKKLRMEQRSKNIQGKFLVVDEDIKGKNILLIDDVITSGNTVFECAKLLKKNGAANIYVWAIAGNSY